MTYVTYVEPERVRFFVVIATGEGTTPTPDGGPWAVEYEVPPEARARLAKVSRTAEEMLFSMVWSHAPAVYERAVELGWMTRRTTL